jgi:hypothetical protein
MKRAILAQLQREVKHLLGEDLSSRIPHAEGLG